METTRRSFIAASGLAAASIAAAAAAGATLGATAAVASEPADDGEVGRFASYEPAEVLEADVVVVGAGPAGVGALLQTLDEGGTVIVLEKTGQIGGMSFGTEGVFGWGSQMQKDAGVELPTILDIIGEELTYTNYRVDANMWRDFVAQSGGTIDWLMDHGIKFDRVDTYQGASFFESFHWWPGGNGADFGPIMSEWLEGKEGLTILLNTRAVDLVVEDGVVKGVYGKREDGSVVQVMGKGVVIATGGFSQDKELMTELSGIDWSHSSGFVTPNTGDGFRLMRSVGADTHECCFINTLCVLTPDLHDLEPINIGSSYECLPVVNQLGERFMAEDTFAKYFAMLTLNALSTQKYYWTLYAQNTIDRLENVGIDYGFVAYKVGDKLTGLRDQLEECAGCDTVKKGETIEELAEQIGADPAILAATVERWNAACEAGYDEDFGVTPSILFPLEGGPYYAVHSDRFVSASIGGIQVDRQNRVLDESGEPIPGLYSGGTDSCCLYKETYNIQLSGGMMAYNVYSGRNAARQIMGA